MLRPDPHSEVLVLRFESKLISGQRFLGFIPKGIIQQNYMYPFGKLGRNGLRKAIQYMSLEGVGNGKLKCT